MKMKSLLQHELLFIPSDKHAFEMIPTEDLSSLMFMKKWDALKAALLKDRSIASIPSSICSCSCIKLHSPLILAVQMNPSLSALECLIEANPFSLFQFDCQGRLPLHLACESGAHPKVIGKLASMNTIAVLVKDRMGRVPLISACESYLRNVDQGISKAEANKCLIEVIDILLKINPACVIEEDKNGICPIEHALYSDVDIEVIQKLQNHSEMERKNQKKRELAEECHEERLCKIRRIC